MKTLTIGRTAAGKSFDLPIEVATEKLGFIGRTGSGKTYGATRLAESMMEVGIQIIAIDPVGVWRGLRMGGDFPIYVFGGLSGDFPLEPTAGELIADLIVDRGISAILDVSQFESDAQKARFAAAFADRFFFRKKANPSAVHLFLEECQEFVPQNPQKGEERMLHAFQRICKLGRNFGIGVSLISQRPQEVNKKALNQTGTLFVFQLTGPQERKAIEGWISDNGVSADDLHQLLPKIKVGQPHVWSPTFLEISETIHIGRKITADVSSTPKVGQAATVRPLSQVETAGLRAAMADTIERAAVNDPENLKAEIRKLRAELESSRGRVATQRVEVPVMSPEQDKLLHELVSTAASLDPRIKCILDEVQALATSARDLRAELRGRIPTSEIPRTRMAEVVQSQAPISASAPRVVTAVAPQRQARQPGPVTPGTHPKGGSGSLGRAERAILTVLVQRHPKPSSRAQMAILSGYSITSSSFANALSALRSAGLMVGSGDHNEPTAAGVEAAGKIEPLSTGKDLIPYWTSKLGKAEATILQTIIDLYPNAVPKDTLSARSGYSETSSSFANALSTLRTLELITRGEIRASSIFFE